MLRSVGRKGPRVARAKDVHPARAQAAPAMAALHARVLPHTVSNGVLIKRHCIDDFEVYVVGKRHHVCHEQMHFPPLRVEIDDGGECHQQAWNSVHLNSIWVVTQGRFESLVGGVGV